MGGISELVASSPSQAALRDTGGTLAPSAHKGDLVPTCKEVGACNMRTHDQGRIQALSAAFSVLFVRGAVDRLAGAEGLCTSMILLASSNCFMHLAAPCVPSLVQVGGKK